MTSTYSIGLDVGGTKIAAAIVNTTTGEMLDYRTVPTRPERGGEAVLDDLATLQVRLLELAEQRQIVVNATGVGVAELVDNEGIVRSGHTIPWKDVDLTVAFRAQRIAVLSDVVAGAVAEARLGAGSSVPSFLYVSVGTGVSSAFVIDGTPWLGANGNAIVLASGPISYPLREPPWLSEFAAEHVASGTGLQQWFAQHPLGTDRLDARAIAEAAATGEPAATEAITVAGWMLGSIVGFAVNVLDPHRVVVGGGLGVAGGLYWTTFLESLQHHVWAPASRSVGVVMARFGEHSGTVGAAVAASETVEPRL
jgi:glucokinase